MYFRLLEGNKALRFDLTQIIQHKAAFRILVWIVLLFGPGVVIYAQSDSTQTVTDSTQKIPVAIPQKAFKLYINTPPETSVKLKFKDTYPDSNQALKALRTIVTDLHQRAYLLAGVDSVKVDAKNRTINAVVFVGEMYQWAKVESGNLSDELARKAGFKERWFSNKPLRPKAFFQMEKALIDYSAENGHPFASIQLDSVRIDNEQVYGVLNYEKGSAIIFDTLRIMGKSRVNRSFLENYLQIKPDASFDQGKLDRIGRMIQQLKAVKLSKPYRIQFLNEKAQVILDLEDIPTNTIDGIAGFQQNPNPLNNTILFTGQFDLGLNNIAGRGKSLEMHWKKTDVASQLLNVSYEHLSLFGSGFHGMARMELFKQDTTFLQRKPYLEFFRNHPALGKLKFFYQLDDSRTIGTQNFVEGTIPTVSSVRTNYYGVGIEWNNLDRVNFARKGWLVDVNGSVGNKRILSSELTTDQNLDPRSLQLKTDAVMEKNFNINQFLGLFTRVRAGWVENENLFLNELYRLGGIKSLRGFREYTFYASQYGIGTFEGRFFLDDESYLLVFSDYAFYENNIASDQKPVNNGPPLGLGAGITFSTKTGVFSFIYALGKEGSNPVNLNNSVINFGLTSRF